MPADAVGSRRQIDWEFALRRIEHAGAVISTTEAVLFEWVERSDRPEFKTISDLVKTFNPPPPTSQPEPIGIESNPGARPVSAIRRLRPPPLDPSPRLLLGPGPSEVHPRVLAALGMPLLGHLDPEFVALMDLTQDLLRYVFQTENRLTMAVSGTGSAGMEAVVVNLIEPGDRMLVCVNGVFGARMVGRRRARRGRGDRDRAALRRGLRPRRGQGGDQEGRSQGRRDRPCRDIHRRLAAGRGDRPDAHEAGALIAIDTVTSLGGVPVEIDAWDIDAVYSGTQKCLSARRASPRSRSARGPWRSSTAARPRCRAGTSTWG